jgi:hypothetical protein
MILEKKQNFWWQVGELLNLHYDPDSPKYRDAPRPDSPPTPKGVVRTPTKTQTAIVADNVTYVPKTKKWIRDNSEQQPTNYKNEAVVFDWDILETPQNTAELNATRQEKLTETDLKLMKERGLDIAKAQTIKAFWFKKIPRNLAAATLSKQAKGYSEAIINPYYTVFNSALKGESPLP